MKPNPRGKGPLADAMYAWEMGQWTKESNGSPQDIYGPDTHDLPTEGGWRQKVPVRHIEFEDDLEDNMDYRDAIELMHEEHGTEQAKRINSAWWFIIFLFWLGVIVALIGSMN